MKRFLPLIIVFISIFPLSGCWDKSEPELTMPTPFYYHNDLNTKDDFNNVFVIEMREGAHFNNDYVSLLNNYLLGPESDNLVNPFPSGLKVVSFTIREDTAYIMLSEQITKLNAVDLTMAYSCISLTLFAQTQCNYVEISAETSLSSDQRTILISRESILLSDATPLPEGT